MNFPDTMDRLSAADQDQSDEKRLLFPAVAVSLCLHIAVLAVFLNARLDAPAPAPLSPESIQIQLLPSNPLLEQVVGVPVEGISEEPIEEIEEEVLQDEALQEVAETAVPEQEAQVAEIEPIDEPVQEQPPDSSPDLPLPAPPEISIPSVLSVRNSVLELEEENKSRLWAYDCDRLQQESDILKCEQGEERNYRLLESNTAYQSLNPTRQLSRAQRSLSTVAQNSSALAARLNSREIPEGLSVYLMEELEAGVTHLSNPGNRSVRHMQEMTDRSAAGALAREILGSDWLTTRSRQLQQRKVELRN